ncbi:MAG: hypothetical protein LC121_10205, partial [Anaerolineae bacterium]|nr:hypothetical protein [Anaerolineae bacterium]
MILPPQGGNVETLTYLGVPVLALAVIGCVAARRWFWAAAAGVAALYALGINGFLWSALVGIAPALLWFRVPSRAWLVVALMRDSAGPPPRPARPTLSEAAVAFAILGSPFTAHVVWLGNTTIIVAASLAGAWWLDRRGRPVVAGM